MKWIVELSDVTKIYKLGKIEVRALRGVSLRVKKGEFLGIIGPSGSGKTTLLHVIGALDRPTEGRIMVDNMDLSALSDGELAKFRNRKIGFVFQFFNLISRMTAIENVGLPMAFAGISGKEREERALNLLVEVGLADRIRHRPFELSGGEQQRVAIARALVNSPILVLCDEPTGNLDTKTGMEIVGLLRKLNREQGQTIVAVTHDPEIAKSADRIAYIHDGIITEIEEVRSAETI
ncbi:MAG: ABC transporter ATP-binding protein [Candidatus Bathyarchaeia archaeon]